MPELDPRLKKISAYAIAHEQVIFRYAFWTLLFAGAARLLGDRIPHSHQLICVPEIFLLLSVMIPFLAFQTLLGKGGAGKVATVVSCVYWLAGIAVAFVVRPGSNWIYASDALLLLGFVPILYLWRFSWTWFIFGAFNFGIGVLLQAIQYMPNSLFPPELVIGKHHLAEFHPAITWWICGVFAVLFGTIRLFNNFTNKR